VQTHLIKPEFFFALRAVNKGHIYDQRIEGNGICREVNGRQKKMDEAVVKAVEELKRSPKRRAYVREGREQGSWFSSEESFMCRRHTLRLEIIRLIHHDTLSAVHPAVERPWKWGHERLVAMAHQICV